MLMSKAETIKSFCIVVCAIGSLELLKWSFPNYKIEVLLFLCAAHVALYLVRSYRVSRSLILLEYMKNTLEGLHADIEKWQCECGHKKQWSAVSSMECIKDGIMKDVLEDDLGKDDDAK